MSLVNFAIRTCLKRALIGRTHAEDRVFDSKVEPFDVIVAAEVKPLILVSTDDDQTIHKGADLNVQGRELDVIVEMVLASPVEVKLTGPDGEPVEGVDLQIPHTDAGMEAVLDFMQRRVMRALAEPGCEWADLYRRFTCDPNKELKRRGASPEKGVKFATRQIVITCEPANEPAYGEPPNALWARFIAALRADDELAPYGAVVEAEIVGAALPSWRALQAALGWTDAEVRGHGDAPLDPDETGEAPLLEA